MKELENTCALIVLVLHEAYRAEVLLHRSKTEHCRVVHGAGATRLNFKASSNLLLDLTAEVMGGINVAGMHMKSVAK